MLLLVENEQQCTDNQILLTDPGQDAFYHASNRTPQMAGFAQIVRVNSPSSR